RRTEVALALNQRIAVGEGLRHQHQRFVAGAVAVRVELADHVADGTGRLLGLGGGAQAQLAHRVDDAPLHRLEAVAQEGQGAVQHHVHRVVQVGALGVLAQRDLLETVEGGAGGFGHAGRLRAETGPAFYRRRPPCGGRPVGAGMGWRWPHAGIAGRWIVGFRFNGRRSGGSVLSRPCVPTPLMNTPLSVSRARLALILAGLAMFGPFSIDTVFPAFPVMASDLGASKLAMQQTISTYLIGYAAMSLFHGPISDAIGRKKVLVAGTVLFALA